MGIADSGMGITDSGMGITDNAKSGPVIIWDLSAPENTVDTPETPDFPMFSISGKLRNSDVSDFQKLQTPTFSEIFVLCNHSLFMSLPFTGDSVRSR